MGLATHNSSAGHCGVILVGFAAHALATLDRDTGYALELEADFVYRGNPGINARSVMIGGTPEQHPRSGRRKPSATSQCFFSGASPRQLISSIGPNTGFRKWP